MKIKAHLYIGFPTATRTAVIEIDDEELEDMTAEEIGLHCEEVAREWADQHIEVTYNVVVPKVDLSGESK